MAYRTRSKSRWLARSTFFGRGNRPLPPVVTRARVNPSPSLFPSYFDSYVKALEDRRTFYPDPLFRPAAALPRHAARIVASSSGGGNAFYPSSRIAFAAPRGVAVCVRRKERREVLHALGKAGGRVSRRRRRTWTSEVDC